MREPLPRGGLIRKLWIGESERYRDHLLRLDAASRRNRFAGAVSDEFVRDYADLSFGIDALIHGFFVDDTLRGAAELRQVGSPITREAEVAFSIEKPWPQVSAHGLPRRQQAHAAARPQIRGRAQLRFFERGRRSRRPPADAALVDARNYRRRPRLRHRHLRRAVAAAQTGLVRTTVDAPHSVRPPERIRRLDHIGP